MTRLLLAVLFGLSTTTTAHAQDFDEFDDSGSGKPVERTEARSEVVREVVKGLYFKSNVGTAIYLGNFKAPTVQAGTSVGLAVGQDFVDNERSSIAWEVDFIQGVHNGLSNDLQLGNGCAAIGTCLQGDLRTYTLGAHLEFATYPRRRFGIGGRVGGGVMIAPQLVLLEGVNDVVLTEGYHSTPHPVGSGGLELEYYSKLSHFSVGLNADAVYAIGFDLSLNASAFLKYTL